MRRRERAEDEVERPKAAVDDEARRAVAVAPTICSTDVPAWISPPSSRICVLERVDQRLVAALEPAHHLGARLVARLGHPARARPDVRRRQVVVAPVELRVEQRRPQPLEHAPAGPALEPLEERRLVELVVGLRELAARDERRRVVGGRAAAGAEMSGTPSARSSRTAARRRRSRPWSGGSGTVAEPELLGEPANAVVGRQDDVVEAIDRVAVEVEGADEPAEVGRALVERDRTPACASRYAAVIPRMPPPTIATLGGPFTTTAGCRPSAGGAASASRRASSRTTGILLLPSRRLQSSGPAPRSTRTPRAVSFDEELGLAREAGLARSSRRRSGRIRSRSVDAR